MNYNFKFIITIVLFFRYSDIAVDTSYLAERNGMNHVRIKIQGKGYKGVKTLDDFASFLELKADIDDLFSHKLKDGSARTLDSRIVKDKNGHMHIIIYNKQLLDELKGGKKCHIDATFGSRPKLTGCSQLLSILVRMFGKVSFIENINGANNAHIYENYSISFITGISMRLGLHEFKS